MRPLDRGEKAIIDAWKREHPNAPEWWIHEAKIDRTMHEQVIAREQRRWRGRAQPTRDRNKQDAMSHRVVAW
jgi:hypothetical protein